MSSLDTKTPQTAQSSPKEQSVLDDDDVPIQSLCPCPFGCGIEPCEITLMKHHIIVNHSSSEPDKTDCDAISTVEEDNIVRRTFMLNQKASSLVTSSVNSCGRTISMKWFFQAMDTVISQQYS